MTREQQEAEDALRAFHRPGSSGVVLLGGPGEGVTFLATGKETYGAYAQLGGVVLPGGGPPLHIHHREDETYYIVEGSLEVRLGDATVAARQGDYIRIPRGTAHTVRNVGERAARVLVTVAPAGLEDFFAEVFQPVAGPTAPPLAPPAELIDRMIQAAPRYGLELLPSPEESRT
jgi:mannose-6-phosphate isomerase-like protein (cupin superfamily)